MLNSLQDWLSWLETRHPTEIELGLDRVGSVWKQLRPEGLSSAIITVAGTNGKGSCVAMLEAIFQAGGYRTGCYTSPHLIRYNERIHINGEEVADKQITEAFERIDKVRGETSLTYFEFGTLAALDIFASENPDIVILEVGLGGRLDAVNILDADVALITSVDIDHTDWLGQTREEIAKEKAGILRAGCPAVFGQTDVPESLRKQAESLKVSLLVSGVDYRYQTAPGGWIWQGPTRKRSGLPEPRLRGRYQLENASAVLMVLDCLHDRFPVTPVAIRQGLNTAAPAGRFQVIPSDPAIVLDVAHNPHAAKALVGNLGQQFVKGSTHAVLGMLRDKSVAEVVSILDSQIDIWYPADLPGARGLSAEALVGILEENVGGSIQGAYSSPGDALSAVRERAGEGDRILVFGSFLTVADALKSL